MPDSKGKKECRPPAHEDHMHHFEEAMREALHNWNGNQDEEKNVTFQIVVSANPGGVKEYRVAIGP
jgi:hypothetical protein